MDLKAFILKGAAGQRVRPAVNRLTRTGHRAEVREPSLAEALVGELKAEGDAWWRRMNGKKKHLSMGDFDPHRIRAQTVATEPDGTDKVTAHTTVLGAEGCGALGGI